jgi:F1F0 ATPase subunit 2
MVEFVTLTLAFVAGICLGVFYFGGLWWTVQKGVTAQNPAFLFLASLIVRTAVVLAGFYFVAQGDWSGLVSSLIGFMMARVIVVRRLTRPPIQDTSPLEQEAGLAP